MVQMTKAEEKVVRYANLEKWDYDKIARFISDNISYIQYESLQGESLRQKTDYIINKFKPKMETKTKVTVLGKEPKKELKKISVTYCLQGNGKDVYKLPYSENLKEYQEVILISKNYSEDLDVILGKHKDHGDVLFMGKWNDGIV